jgi:OOP family OmpA-OmpF porin
LESQIIMKKALFAIISASAALTGVSAHAQSSYVGVGVTATPYEYSVNDAASDSHNNGTKAGAKIFAGYDFDKTYGVEVGYTDFGSQDYAYTQNGAAGKISTDSHSFYVAGKATMPLTQQVSLVGKLGVANNYQSVSTSGAANGLVQGDSNVRLYGAVGAAYAINEKVSLTADYEHYGKTSDYGRKSGAFTVGAKYSF